MDKAETDIKILFVNGVFRLDKNTDDDGNPEKTNENKQGGLQIFVKAVYAELGDTVGAKPDADKEKGDGAKGEEIFRRREFIGEFFEVLLVFHVFIITRRKKKGKLIAGWKISRKNNFFHEISLFSGCKRLQKGV